MKKYLVLFIAFGTLAAVFNNCGPLAQPAFEIDSASLNGGDPTLAQGPSSAECTDDLKAVFAETYQPFLVQNCASCHGAAHGSADVNVAFPAFMDKSRIFVGSVNLIDYQATHAHGGNSNSTANQPFIDAFKPAWNAGRAQYDLCMAGVTGEDEDAHNLRLNGKTIAGLSTTLTNSDTWVPVSWNIPSEITDSSKSNLLHGSFAIEARYLLNSGNVVGLMFRNPKVTLASGQSDISLHGIGLRVSDQPIVQFTTYLTLDVAVSGTSPVNVAPGFGSALVMYPGLTALSTVAFELVNIGSSGGSVPTGGDTGGTGGGSTGGGSTGGGTSTPAAITFADLTGTDATKNIFKAKCYGCHSDAVATSGINTQNYTNAKFNASKIQARMNNSANPMPPLSVGGMLSTSQRALIDSWISGGLKQQ